MHNIFINLVDKKIQNFLHLHNWCYYFNFSVNGIIFYSMFMF